MKSETSKVRNFLSRRDHKEAADRSDIVKYSNYYVKEMKKSARKAAEIKITRAAT